MTFFTLYLQAFAVIMAMMTLLWLASVVLKNASIVDPFWGPGFVLAAWYTFFQLPETSFRDILILTLASIWGLRLGIFLFVRNFGKGEDYRYQEFRRNYGPKRYWWFSFFQVFLLQGVLMWLVSAPLLAAMYFGDGPLKGLDFLALAVWILGISFEAGGDFQLAIFKSKPTNKGKVLQSGFWKYTRHPNYFGDAAVWWAYGLFAIAAGSYISPLGSLLMTLLIIRVSGVMLLEKSLKKNKAGYAEYTRKTSAFIPWFPKK